MYNLEVQHRQLPHDVFKNLESRYVGAAGAFCLALPLKSDRICTYRQDDKKFANPITRVCIRIEEQVIYFYGKCFGTPKPIILLLRRRKNME